MNSSRSLEIPSTPRWRRPSGTASSTSPARPRASASTSSRSTPTNQSALITLLLALTDQFGTCVRRAPAGARVLAALDSEYDKAYYAGIIAERRAKAQLAHGGAGSSVGATTGSSKRCSISNAPNGCARPATTTRGCDGTPARGFSTVIRISARRPRSGARSRCSSRADRVEIERDWDWKSSADPNLGLPLRSRSCARLIPDPPTRMSDALARSDPDPGRRSRRGPGLRLRHASRRGSPPSSAISSPGCSSGRYTPGFVADRHMAEQLAEVGVILLMFGVGLQFHVEELLAVWRVAVPGAMAQSVVATGLGHGGRPRLRLDVARPGWCSASASRSRARSC